MPPKKGPSALVLSPPFYYTLSQSAFLGYLERLVPLLPLPLYLYNMPNYTKLVISPETVRAAAEDSEDLWPEGQFRRPRLLSRLQAGGGRPARFRASRRCGRDPRGIGRRRRARRRMRWGESLSRLYVQLYEAAVRGDRELVARLQKIVMIISGRIYTIGEPGSAYLRGLKTAMSVLGIGNGYMAEPYQPLSADERETLGRAVMEVQALLSECMVTGLLA